MWGDMCGGCVICVCGMCGGRELCVQEIPKHRYVD